MTDDSPIRDVPGGARVTVRVVPRAGVTSVDGVVQGALRFRVAGPPVDGRANAELARHLARVLGVSAAAVEVVAGERARVKIIDVKGLDAAAVTDRLGLADG